eukprot:CAMPEP_0198284864 /NCGR_PEP_ID=MMETSP1449-20131203/4260_1 /TAXON_ID=420275 /ORGANISM="Attheya septentrionalis, Strain CCMP2084" /LENGTH=135 /DNA_ID=CAMNT_0043982085 /DNA_START=40 /DNA_END=447 /DNA_ORIENTATION=-
MSSTGRSLYVGGLAEEVTLSTMRASMIPFGPISTIDMPMDYAKGLHKGFCFVEFEDADDAAEAIYNMDGAEVYGRTLTVNVANPNKVQLGSNKAAWSTDDWFKESVGIESEGDKLKKQAASEDQSALKETAPLAS